MKKLWLEEGEHKTYKLRLFNDCKIINILISETREKKRHTEELILLDFLLLSTQKKSLSFPTKMFLLESFTLYLSSGIDFAKIP